MGKGELTLFGCENGSIVDPPSDLDFLDCLVATFLGDDLLVSLVASLAMPCVYADFLAVLVLRSALGEPEIYAAVVGEFSAGALGEELFAIGLVDVMEWLIGTFAVFWIHALVNVAGDVLSVFCRSTCLPGSSFQEKPFSANAEGMALIHRIKMRETERERVLLLMIVVLGLLSKRWFSKCGVALFSKRNLGFPCFKILTKLLKRNWSCTQLSLL